MHSAQQLISQHVVTGFPEQRLAYLSEKIRNAHAHYCAVLQPRTYILVGLVRFSEVAANPTTATRIFADLMHAPPACRVDQNDPIQHVVDCLETEPAEIVVTKATGEFVGLITPESFIRWLLSIKPMPALNLEKIPANSRWHPYPSSPGEAAKA